MFLYPIEEPFDGFEQVGVMDELAEVHFNSIRCDFLMGVIEDNIFEFGDELSITNLVLE